MYWSPHALTLTMRELTSRIKGSAFSSPDPHREPDPMNYYLRHSSENGLLQNPEIESFSRSRSIPLKYVGYSIPYHEDEARSHERYVSLVESIEIGRVEAIKERWIKNACQLAHLKNFPLVPPARQEMLVSEMLDEVQFDYEQSIRRAISDYVLLNPNERDRLGIKHTPQESAIARFESFTFGDTLQRGLNMPSEEWSQSVRKAKEFIQENLLTSNVMSLALESLWGDYYSSRCFLMVPSNFEYTPSSLDTYKDDQFKYSEATIHQLKTRWYPAIVRLFLSPPPHPTVYSLPSASARLFKAIRVQMNRQMRGLFERTFEGLAEFIESFKPLSTEQFELAVQGKSDPASIPPFNIRIVVQGSHIRISPSLEQFQQDLCLILDNVVTVCEGFPLIEPGCLSPYSPFAPADKAIVPESPISDETIDNDALTISKQLFENTKLISSIRVARSEEYTVVTTKQKVCHALEENMDGPKRMVERYEAFCLDRSPVPGVPILNLDSRWESEYKAARHSLEEYKRDILLLREAAQDVAHVSIQDSVMGLYNVQTDPVVKGIAMKCTSLADMLLNQVLNDNSEEMSEICARFEAISARAMEKPRESHEMKELKLYLENVPNELAILKEKTAQVAKRMEFLYELGKEISDEEMLMNTNTYRWPARLQPMVEQALDKVLAQEEGMEEDLKKRQKDFEGSLLAAVQEIDTFQEFGNPDKVAVYLQKIVDMKGTLDELEKELLLINEQEEIFGWNPTVNPAIESSKQAIEPVEAFIQTILESQKSLGDWYSGPLRSWNPEKVEGDVDNMTRAAYKYCKQYSDQPELLKIAESMKASVAEFKPHVPLMMIFCNRGLRDRHWDQMADVVGQTIKPTDKTSLNDMIAKKLNPHLTKLEEISDAASKEYSLEKNLDKQLADWQETVFVMTPYRDSGTSILAGSCIDEIQAILDDQIVKTQTMLASPYIKPFEDRAKDWENFLVVTQDIIDIWLKVQAQWLYLEPIFASDDIKKQMPAEADRFIQVDRTFRDTSSRCIENPKVLNFTRTDGLLDSLKNSFELLELINKGLNAYLEQKRLFFSRFFFLSNDELLEILAETKDPTRVQPHLKKCFEAIAKLKFDDQLIIHGMVSSEGELVPWPRTLDPATARGAVEKWLVETEHLMKDAMMDQTIKAYEAYPTVPRKQWVLEWPGMTAIVIGQMYWTLEVEKAIQEPDGKGVGRYADKCTQQLDDLIELVRGKLSKLQRQCIGALVVLDVHARDMTVNLSAEGVSSILDFSWLAQLRYYMQEERVACKMITACIMYGYEYLGVSSRLVVTPLTDRCYRTLMGALQLKLGGAPEGPAGTGKTETTKDLAKAISNYCVVFNCSDGLDYLAMGKFFKGVVSCGAWACFDEFNRIDLEVLSVVAQQIMSIQRAIVLGQTEFDFEGSHLRVISSCAVFITMNPGYAGRSDLPDNLKVLFRTVAMMVPDYAMIGEIMLMSFGFSDARVLARKIVATYKLCSEQLSSQTHYDYGMRAVMAVLRAAGNLKQADKDSSEDILMLRAIRDVNVPKFLSHDLPLFEGIAKDLFPSTVLPAPDYVNMLASMNRACEERNLQTTSYFLQKTIELYEMIVVRHGLMVVGLSYGGKTCSYRVLADTLGHLCTLGQNEENKVRVYCMNPKSITMGQLYGQFDPVSHEWSDGILAINFRTAASDQGPDRKWVMFDGPVDAVWIENMNTVLDDNKKLCLVSGEIIQMSSSMNMIFEPQDLEVASPATVSRCGMVYYEPHQMGLYPSLGSWLNTLPETISSAQRDMIESLFKWIIPPTIKFIRRELREVSPTSDIMLGWAFLKLFESLMVSFKVEPNKFQMQEKDASALLEGIFLFSLTWSICCTVDAEGRDKMDAFVKEVCAGTVPTPYNEEGERGSLHISNPFPKEHSIYSSYFDAAKGKWATWGSLIANHSIDANLQPHEIIVPTVDTTRYTYLLDTCCQNGRLTHDLNRMAFLLCGPTGTGKTIYINNHLLNGLHPDKFNVISLGFSAQTSANQTQEIIESKLDKRRKGVLGPPIGKVCITFIDDLNMPKKETYGAQPPIEILRQYMDHHGWYDLKEKSFMKIEDMMYVAAMGPPGGGRTFITPRFLRWFNMISVTEFDNEVMTGIFSTIMKHAFDKNNTPTAIKGLQNAAIQATMEVYEAALKNLLPTPDKSHYLFNLRDFGRVVMGICMADTASMTEPAQFCRLWCHEIMRVFYDRLTDDKDREWLIETLRTKTKARFSQDFDKILEHLKHEGEDGIVSISHARRLLFGDFQKPDGKRVYEEMPNPEVVIEACNGYLEYYNATCKKPMDLVLFLFMIEHITRICRILRSPGGNALLIGIGGSGRQSCTRLAASIMDYTVVEIEISKTYGKNEWREDLKRLLTVAGGDGKPTVFLFTDTQIKMESFVEDLNNLLNTAEVPNLFASDEKAVLAEKCRPAAKAAGRTLNTPADQYAFFIERCKSLMHIVLAFSPIGDAFRSRLRQFPSLVNCCTIDWFTEWPSDALESVAKRFLSDVEMEEETRMSCVSMCISMHENVAELSGRFLSETRRHNYVTPTSYLELINTYKTLLKHKREQINMQIKRYTGGLGALALAETSVNTMKQELIDLQPGLLQAQKDTEALTAKVEAAIPGVDAQKAVAMKDEEATAKQAAEVQKVKEECEADLAEAIPILNDALKALDTIKKQDIDLVKSMAKPPAGVQLAMKAVLVMLDLKPDKKNDPDKPGAKIDDWWSPAVRLLNTGTLLQSLKTYDKDNIPPKIIERIRKEFQPDPGFTPAQIAKASTAAEGLCKWVLAMEGYDRVAKIVAPKKAALAVAEGELAEAMKVLERKRADLKKVVDELNGLKNQLRDCAEKKADLEAQAELCALKLERAEQLIAGLGGEKSRWTAVAQELQVEFVHLTGDVLVSSAYVAYLGAFMKNYRDDVISQWIHLLGELSVPRSDTFVLSKVLGDPVKIRDWSINGLPSDAFSIDNGIIVTNARRWPLCIDPQGQANKWFRNTEKKNGLKVIKLTDTDFVRTLENSIQFGNPVLLENVLQELDPTLEPLLLKQTFRQGGVMCIRLGDATIEYSNNFRFYITSKLPNPHYMPETAVKVTLLNFMITQDGLQDQLLGIVVAEERPDLEEEKNVLIVQGAENKRKLRETEDKILEVLSAEGNILENTEGIQVLKDAKVLSNDIEEKQKVAEETEAKIDEARAGYKPVAWRASILFFAISSLNSIEPMYQYSLTWFIALFRQSVKDSEPSSELEKRLASLDDHFTYFLYKMVCRSLFEKDKLLFSFLLCSRLMRASERLEEENLRFLLTGGVAVGETPPNPFESWLVERSWGEITRLSHLKVTSTFKDDFVQHGEEWKEIFESSEPYKLDFPGNFKDCDPFTRLLIIRSIRSDKIVPAVMLFVANEMGQQFIEPPPFDLAACYEDSDPCTPLIFILSAGSDPNAALFKLADEKGFGETIKSVSLGQGQGPIAAKYVEDGYKNGTWVVLQNCHVYGSWMVTLERICEEFKPETANKNFRLWLTSYPSSVFPVSVLQNGIKMTNESAKGIRLNVKGSFLSDPIGDEEFFTSCKKPLKWKKLVYALSFFHAVIQERRSFGPLGWNIPYEFTAGDMSISVKQTKMMLDEYEEDQFKALNYLIGECNYGGRVTDDKDRRYLLCALSDFYNPFVYNDDYGFSPSGLYKAPPDIEHMEHSQIIDYILQMPLTQQPEVFGLHDNADITKDQQETNYFCDTMLSTEAGSSGGGGGGSGKSADEVLDELAEGILARVPQMFDRERVMKKFPIRFDESMNTVLSQELIRYNGLIDIVRSSLSDLRKALKGLIVMSADLEQVQVALNTGKVPGLWSKKSYPSLKPLGGYIADLLARLSFFQSWIDNKQPATFWLSGFFFVHAFMTGAMQNFARKYTLPVDTLNFEHIMMEEEHYETPPANGVYVHGPFSEGCRWNKLTNLLEESEPKVLFSPMPVMWFSPKEMPSPHCMWKEEREEDGSLLVEGFYVAPLYNTSARRGVLATTGHSSNFVCPIVIPTAKPQSHWIKRGAALLMQLDD